MVFGHIVYKAGYNFRLRDSNIWRVLSRRRWRRVGYRSGQSQPEGSSRLVSSHCHSFCILQQAHHRSRNVSPLPANCSSLVLYHAVHRYSVGARNPGRSSPVLRSPVSIPALPSSIVPRGRLRNRSVLISFIAYPQNATDQYTFYDAGLHFNFVETLFLVHPRCTECFDELSTSGKGGPDKGSMGLTQ